MHSNPSHRSNPQYRGLSDAEFTTRRRKEMEDEVKTRLIENVASVVDNAQPRELQNKALAAEIAEDIARIIEAMVSSVLNSDAPATNNNSGGGGIEGGILNTGTTLHERQAFSRALPWICSTNNNEAAQRTEQPLYGQISAFILLVAHLLKRLLTDRGQSKKSDFRLILPYEKMDITPDGADDGSRIDIALRWRSMKARVEPQPDLTYRKIMAVGEIKRDSKGGRVKGAYAQLFDYTRNIYYCQIDRRFAWGLICCGSVVNACIFGNYHAFASPDIDMTTAMGRFEFIRLLVGWSLCDMHQLGYDETIQIVKGLGCYRIMVPNVDNPSLSTAYYTNEFVMGAERLFGRHCRCLLATDSLPSEKVTEGRPIKATVVIKDSWTIYSATKDLQSQGNDSGGSSISGRSESGVAEDMARMRLQSETAVVWPDKSFVPTVVSSDVSTARSEIAMLYRIKDGLKNYDELKGTYPMIETGGWVYQPTHAGPVLDSTREIIDGLEFSQQQKIPFCLHVRYAMSPIGRRFQSIETVPELLIVLHDVMRCHTAIHERCGILHRDISVNNIMAVDTEQGIRGLLIDYDCAIDKSITKEPVRCERTGTLPFMSIANLSKLPIPHSVLDDWESLLYLICWVGTFGITSANTVPVDDRQLLIREWAIGDMEIIAKAKRATLDNYGAFKMNIIDGFNQEQPYCEILQVLAERLRATLICNKRLDISEQAVCHGATLKEPPGYTDEWIFSLAPEKPIAKPSNIDPFVERVRHAKAISADLLAILERYAKMARNAHVHG
ncbi:hypothetical protein H4S08_003412 [Coemansia sp. RSA 1365]|nr:hypothetical protein H4S08_003412 [Coemansia sp. RSA 1365]